MFAALVIAALVAVVATQPATPPTPPTPPTPATPSTPATPPVAFAWNGPNDCDRVRGVWTSDEGAGTIVRIADDTRCLEIRATGRVEFTDDDSDVRALEPGTSLRVTERRGGTTRALSLFERNGRIDREYRVDGVRVPEGESSAWLRETVLDIVRSTGFGATERVARLRRQRGVGGVLDEVGQLRADHVRRIYLEALLAGGGLTDDDVRRIVRIAGTQMHSDHDKAQVLLAATESRGTQRDVAAAIAIAGATITSDHDRGRVLTAIVTRAQGDAAPIVTAIDASREMGSDHERSQLLATVVARTTLADPATRTSFFRAVDGMDSDYERRSVLLSVIARDGVTTAAVRGVLGSAARLGSDHDKASVLLAVGAHGEWLREPTVRSAFDTAVKTVGSDAEYRRVMRLLEP
jgi:hypothetical protein